LPNELRFYFDESVQIAISEQLALNGIDVVSAHSLDTLGNDDLVHLQRATQMGRVICTYDDDFLRLVVDFADHAGVVYVHQEKATIGGWVRAIRDLHSRITPEEAKGQVFFLSMK